MTWERGRTDIERLIADGELERVTPSDEVASRLLADADAHIVLASKGVEDDPAGALQHPSAMSAMSSPGTRLTVRPR